MGINTFNNTFNKKASVAQGDNATAIQNIYNSKEFHAGLVEMYKSATDAERNEIDRLTDEVIKLIEDKKELLPADQVAKLEKAKVTSETTLKLAPAIVLIASAFAGSYFESAFAALAGAAACVSSDLKWSIPIKPDSMISFLSKFTGNDLQITGFNELDV